MAFSRSALISRLLRLNHPRPAVTSARSFHATTCTLSAPPKDDPADSTQSLEQNEDMETLAEKASRMISDMKEKIKSINPDFQFPNFDNREDFESLTKTAHRMVSDMRKKIKADHPEVSPKFWEVLYWHPFQDEGNQLPYDVKVEDDCWYGRVDMPGIGSKGVRVWFENNTLHFKGEEKDKGPFHGARNYSGKFNIPASEYQIDKISAVMNDGVLNIVIPKIDGAL
ncbi:hypothetical protein POPTR_003G075900v4 [Populus trichocarpa]|uniref:SHSP domain-containing protein n=1 Tax=Populus trichocarpa TaxID=3694 RepID=A9PE56_POPTR|nr:uncharacterized protein LOC7461973 isoform X1 [Populus trichocarpa]ABK94659.1 unknown [Populus trichocarpa]KAI5594324.1 hypothetical protein BDE02_03G066100 [Populus trichocarpa]PNT44220.1 hypothetical protein POPTR_003G075900v4 [Populus trichocarpa]|eukprot:XP_002304269.1 uncharacterized protein LOC7461973 isoform X1 [Populus trichocarpa]